MSVRKIYLKLKIFFPMVSTLYNPSIGACHTYYFFFSCNITKVEIKIDIVQLVNLYETLKMGQKIFTYMLIYSLADLNS